MKKILVVLLVLSMFAFLLSNSVAEEEQQELVTSGDWEYWVQKDGSVVLSRYIGNDQEVKVPEKIDEKVVTMVGDQVFSYCSSIESITIPDGVMSIGDVAFSCCSSLTSIVIPDSLRSIGENPFLHCEMLTDIQISPDHPYLDVIDGVVISKPDMRLVGCTGLFKTADYKIPQGIRIIGNDAFRECSSLISVIIPDSVTSIGNGAFGTCFSLQSVTIPNSVTSIGANPFFDCGMLTDIYVSPDHSYLAIIDGVLFSKPDKRLICYPLAFDETQYSIPQGIQIIGDSAFRSSSLISIMIPDSVKYIGYGAFGMNFLLSSITIPNSVTSIGASAFSFCSSLTSITIPDGVTSIGSETFMFCSSLSSIMIPDSVTSIADDAFLDCDSLSEVIVNRNSYAKQYCVEKGIKYSYTDANDWLND